MENRNNNMKSLNKIMWLTILIGILILSAVCFGAIRATAYGANEPCEIYDASEARIADSKEPITTDMTRFAVPNDGYELAADTANNRLTSVESRTYYYNYFIFKDGDDLVVSDISSDGTSATEICRGPHSGMDLLVGNYIDTDRLTADKTYKDCTITFGIGGNKLDLGDWILYCQNGNYTIKGSVTSAGMVTVSASLNANVTIDANINNTRSAQGSAIKMSSKASVKIVGGTISSLGQAIYNQSAGLLTVSQDEGKTTLITSATADLLYDSNPGTIYISSKASLETEIFRMTGGKVVNTGATGIAIMKYEAKGAVSFSGGEISANTTALYFTTNYSGDKTGETTISGGTFTAKSNRTTDGAIVACDKFTISGGNIIQNGKGKSIWFSGGEKDSTRNLSITGSPTIKGQIYNEFCGINGAGYNGELITLYYYSSMLKDYQILVYGSVDTSKWAIESLDYYVMPDSETGNLIARWKLTVTFKSSVITVMWPDIWTKRIQVGETVKSPGSSAVIGLDFGGWYADSDFVQVFDFNKAITSDTTIYAKWTLPDLYISIKNVNTTYDGATHSISIGISRENEDKIDYTYRWSLNGNIMPGLSGRSFTYGNVTTNAKYTCVVTATFGTQTKTATVTSVVTVNKAKLTVRANDQTIKYGKEIAQTDYTVSGFVGSDKINVISGKPVLGANATTVKDGNAILVNVDGMTASNYSFTGVNGALKIEKADYTSAPTHKEITGTYDKTKTLASYNLDAGFKWKTPDEKPTVAVTSYGACYNADPDNYNDLSVNIAVMLSKQKITVPTIDSKIYNGLIQTADLEDNEYFVITANQGGKDVKEDYAVILTLKDFANTEWDVASGLSGTHNETLTLSFAITKRAITVTIANQRSVQGKDIVNLATAPSAWNVTVGNIVTNDELNITLSTVADKNTIAVSAITGTAANTNYQVTFVNGSYSVYSVEEFEDFIAKYGTTIDITPGTITITQVDEIIAMHSVYDGLGEDSLLQFTQQQKDKINVLKNKADAVIIAKAAAEEALKKLDGVTAQGLRNGVLDLDMAEKAIATAKEEATAYADLSSGITTADLANYASIAAAEKAIADYKAYKTFADSHGDIYAKDPVSLTYPEVTEVDEMYAAYLLLTEDVKSVLTKEEATNIAALKDKADRLIEMQGLEKVRDAAINELITERDQLLASSAYSSSAKKEIAEYYANAIKQIAISTDASEITKNKEACIEKMKSVEVLHVGLLVANLIFAVLLIGEILFLIIRKMLTHKKKDTKTYSSVLPLALFAAASGTGLIVGITCLVILILAVVALGIYIVSKVLGEIKGRNALSPIADKVDGLVKKCVDGIKKLLGKNTVEKAIKADLTADTATTDEESPVSDLSAVAVESPISDVGTPTNATSEAEEDAQ